MKTTSANSCFDEFNTNAPRKKDPKLQTLLMYRESYMKLLEEHQEIIQFLQDLIVKTRAEEIEFYQDTLVNIKKKLNEDTAIDDVMKQLWLKRIEENMARSFDLSHRLLDDFAVKQLDEFKQEAEIILSKV